MNTKKFLIKNKKAGMGFVEMIVVISIFAVMSTAVFFNQREYSDSIGAQNSIADFALTIKEIQTRALSGSYPPLAFVQAPPLSDWRTAYGFFYSAEDPQNMIYFFDRDGDGQYNGDRYSGNLCGAATSECIKTIPLDALKASISLCFNSRSNPSNERCSTTGLPYAAHIVFTRPKVDAGITSKTVLDVPIGDVTLKFLQGNKTRSITIWSTGLIETK